MKKVIALLLISSPGIGLRAQSLDTNWIRQYDRISAYGSSVAAALDDGSYLVAYASSYYHIDAGGDSITKWENTNTFGTVQAMLGLSDGVLIAGDSNGTGAISKLDANFNTEWTTVIGTTYGQASALLQDGSDFYTSGRNANELFISKFNASGDVEWTSFYPQTTFTNFSSIIKLSDGNFLASGNLDDYPIAIKFDASGDSIWSYYEPMFISFTKMSAFERDNGDIVLIARNRQIVLDEDGEKLSDATFANVGFNDVWSDGDHLYMAGYHRVGTSNEFFPVIQIRNSNLDSLGVFLWNDNMHPFANNEFYDIVATQGGGFLAVGKLRDSVNVSANTYNVLAAKFNDDTLTHLSAERVMPQIKVYPNPATDQVLVDGLAPGTRMELFDLQGRLWLSAEVTQSSQRLDVSELPSGVYIIHAERRNPMRWVLSNN